MDLAEVPLRDAIGRGLCRSQMPLPPCIPFSAKICLEKPMRRFRSCSVLAARRMSGAVSPFAGGKEERSYRPHRRDPLGTRSGARLLGNRNSISLATGKVLYSQNADKLFTPASNTKLFTTAASLALIGPDYKFRTSVETNGMLDTHGRLNGDLVLVGRGDPNLSGRELPYDLQHAAQRSSHQSAGGSGGQPGAKRREVRRRRPGRRRFLLRLRALRRRLEPGRPGVGRRRAGFGADHQRQRRFREHSARRSRRRTGVRQYRAVCRLLPRRQSHHDHARWDGAAHLLQSRTRLDGAYACGARCRSTTRAQTRPWPSKTPRRLLRRYSGACWRNVASRFTAASGRTTRNWRVFPPSA